MAVLDPCCRIVRCLLQGLAVILSRRNPLTIISRLVSADHHFLCNGIRWLASLCSAFFPERHSWQRQSPGNGTGVRLFQGGRPVFGNVPNVVSPIREASVAAFR